MFHNRIDAGEQLADALKKYKDLDNGVVMALPRGGVVPASVIAKKLNLPLEVTMVKKLGHPGNPEFAIGAVSLTSRVINGHSGISDAYIEEATRNTRELLRKRYLMYHGNRPPIAVKDKIVIVVDDGVATGKTLIASLELIRKGKPNQIIVAVPVGPKATLEDLKQYADTIVCLETYDNFTAVGSYYEDFDQVSDEEVKELLSIAYRPNLP
ncbi:MAG: phosphoribosyltransferase [Bacteroidia bacterium]